MKDDKTFLEKVEDLAIRLGTVMLGVGVILAVLLALPLAVMLIWNTGIATISEVIPRINIYQSACLLVAGNLIFGGYIKLFTFGNKKEEE